MDADDAKEEQDHFAGLVKQPSSDHRPSGTLIVLAGIAERGKDKSVDCKDLYGPGSVGSLNTSGAAFPERSVLVNGRRRLEPHTLVALVSLESVLADSTVT
jgi:hypothetical protein